MSESTPVVAGRIFISYRRDDTPAYAGWLFERLTDHFPRGQVFKDIDSIQLGDDFVEEITNAVASCHVLLALIGDRWLTLTDKDGRRRLDNPKDYVRLEIEAALKRNVRVIPILVDGVQMPGEDQLPDSLARLVRRQALFLSANRFRFDTGRLLKVLDRTVTKLQDAAGVQDADIAMRAGLLGRDTDTQEAANWQYDEQAHSEDALPVVSIIGKTDSKQDMPEIGVWKLLPGNGARLGAIYDGKGTDFSLFSSAATRVELCLVEVDGHEERIDLPERNPSIWGGYIKGIRPGQRYGYRVYGTFDPENGLRCNPSKFLIDPYAKAICGEVKWGQEVFSHDLDDESKVNTDDSREYMPKSVVVDPNFDWTGDTRLNIPLSDSVIYEAHVKGLTVNHPEIPEPVRGTYQGLSHQTMIDHFKHIGVTAVQLMPVHHFVQDGFLLERGLSNYWGYNTVGFFAPHAPYASSGQFGQQVLEFKEMVKTLHIAGIEVILDVVFNHTAEGNHLGPTLSFRGIDNTVYYHLEPKKPFFYTDFTGTGNTLNASNAWALKLVMDSLRYWVEEMHVDGFRFDLASALAREKTHFEKESTFFTVIQQDPILSDIKLIAEPWDASPNGYQVGSFPVRWSELNGKFRDRVRNFWRGKGRPEALAESLNGSPDLYKASRRRPYASINFVTSHDGFTLMDLVSYEQKHNEDNGYGNRDGTDDNRTWNCGVEGQTDDLEINKIRRRQRKNMLTSLMLSQGVPLLLAGDELGRTQKGNNNAYCQDNSVSWIGWNELPADQDIREFVADLTKLRRDHSIFRRQQYMVTHPISGLRGVRELAWLSTSGDMVKDGQWTESDGPIGMFLNGQGIRDLTAAGQRITDDSFILYFNPLREEREIRLPSSIYGRSWDVVIDTAKDESVGESEATYSSGSTLRMASNSMLVLKELS